MSEDQNPPVVLAGHQRKTRNQYVRVGAAHNLTTTQAAHFISLATLDLIYGVEVDILTLWDESPVHVPCPPDREKQHGPHE